MPTKLAVYCNEDDALLAWSTTGAVPDCRGFAIERRRTRGGQLKQSFLRNRVGFEGQAGDAAPEADELRPSTEWPFQTFTWTDHTADSGDTVSYRIVPMVRRGAGQPLEPLEAEASPWSVERTLGTEGQSPFKPYFNRGFVMSQFMGRYLRARNLTLDQFKAQIRDEDDLVIRRFLSGDLRQAALRMLAEAGHDGHVYAALYELDDDELIGALCGLGPRAHVVLANGSIKKREDETTAEARRRDQNQSARGALRNAGVDVELAHRFLSPGALGHNKFLVVTDALGQARLAWTGSMNWTPTGLCTQVNNGLRIEHTEVAAMFLEQWRRLRAAGSDFPEALTASNQTAKDFGDGAAGTIRGSVWFTRTRDTADLAALREAVQRARQGLLFLMFMPGGTGVLPSVLAASANPALYVRGVVSDLPAQDESEVEVGLITSGGIARTASFNVVEPGGLAHPFAFWGAEVTRREFLQNVGFAIIHSKVLVIDPFSDEPTVVTGSHNFSTSASAKNDENFIIIRGDRGLAEAHAVNILGAYNHYRWRAHVAATPQPWSGTKDNDAWMGPMLAQRQAELRFWGV
jgi:phosphatidylserine/phosphatidylglycerophosphate/cardiolipin synthase-like enzyme